MTRADRQAQRNAHRRQMIDLEYRRRNGTLGSWGDGITRWEERSGNDGRRSMNARRLNLVASMRRSGNLGQARRELELMYRINARMVGAAS